MFKASIVAASLAAFVAMPAVAETTFFNTAPSDGWYMGSGNDYSPANTTLKQNSYGD